MYENALKWLESNPTKNFEDYQNFIITEETLRLKAIEDINAISNIKKYVTINNEEPTIPKSKVFSKKTVAIFSGITAIGVAYIIINFMLNYHPIY